MKGRITFWICLHTRMVYKLFLCGCGLTNFLFCWKFRILGSAGRVPQVKPTLHEHEYFQFRVVIMAREIQILTFLIMSHDQCPESILNLCDCVKT